LDDTVRHSGDGETHKSDDFSVKHYHITGDAASGEEYINVVLEDPYDTAIQYVGLVSSVFQNYKDREQLLAEEVAMKLQGNFGFQYGVNRLVLYAYGCPGGCTPSKWN